MSATDHVDGTAEDLGAELAHVEHGPANLFRTDDPVEVVERATKVANALKALLVAQGLTQNIQGKAHVRVEGWQALGAMLGVTAICTHTEEVDGGWKATVEARAADGRVIGKADAMCTKFEKRGPWKTADDYARLSMAQTRATSKALKGPLGFVVSLAGYQTTPAEEMTFVEPDATPAKPEPIIDADRASQIGLSIHEALAAELLDPPGLSSLITKSGAKPDVINAEAIANLTITQAAFVEEQLFELLKDRSADGAFPAAPEIA